MMMMMMMMRMYISYDDDDDEDDLERDLEPASRQALNHAQGLQLPTHEPLGPRICKPEPGH